jgi:hypothetical protein
VLPYPSRNIRGVCAVCRSNFIGRSFTFVTEVLTNSSPCDSRMCAKHMAGGVQTSDIRFILAGGDDPFHVVAFPPK